MVDDGGLVCVCDINLKGEWGMITVSLLAKYLCHGESSVIRAIVGYGASPASRRFLGPAKTSIWKKVKKGTLVRNSSVLPLAYSPTSYTSNTE